MINAQSKVTKYRPEFSCEELKKPLMDLTYLVNEADVYDEIDFIVKVFNMETKVSTIGTKYIQCSVIDSSKVT